jgi:hypothetical protein
MPIYNRIFGFSVIFPCSAGNFEGTDRLRVLEKMPTRRGLSIHRRFLDPPAGRSGTPPATRDDRFSSATRMPRPRSERSSRQRGGSSKMRLILNSSKMRLILKEDVGRSAAAAVDWGRP